MQKFFDTNFNFDFNRTFVWGDTHFEDRNILDKRPMFTNVEDHDMHIVDSWNEVVNPDDIGIIVGDLGVASNRLEDLLDMMDGHKFIVPGNHDNPRMLERLLDLGIIEGIMGVMYIRRPNQNGVIISHVPVHESVLYGAFPVNIHGHLHHNDVLKHDFTKDDRYINVCVEKQMDKPFVLSELMNL